MITTAFALLYFAPPQHKPVSITVDVEVAGFKRSAILDLPEEHPDPNSPVVFVFHGHGGTGRNMQRRMELGKLWPEAVGIYPQGLNTPGRTDPQGLKPGWQKTPGDQQDRDLKFFDALTAKLRADHKLSLRHVFVTGHSNGGGFTFLLWAERGSQLTAVAPSSAGGAALLKNAKPLPMLIFGGRQDPIVPFEGLQRSIEECKLLNKVAQDGQTLENKVVWYKPLEGGQPVATYIHDGGHVYLPEAPKLTVWFFRDQILNGNQS